MCVCRPTWALHGTSQQHRGRGLKSSITHFHLHLSWRQRKPVAALTAELKQQQCSRSSFVQFPLQVSCSCFGSGCSRCSLLGSKWGFFWLGFLCAHQRQGRQLFLSLEVKWVLSFELDDKSKLFLDTALVKDTSRAPWAF